MGMRGEDSVDGGKGAKESELIDEMAAKGRPDKEMGLAWTEDATAFCFLFLPEGLFWCWHESEQAMGERWDGTVRSRANDGQIRGIEGRRQACGWRLDRGKRESREPRELVDLLGHWAEEAMVLAYVRSRHCRGAGVLVDVSGASAAGTPSSFRKRQAHA